MRRINYNNILLNRILMQELDKINTPKYIQLYSTDWKLSVDNIKDYMKKGTIRVLSVPGMEKVVWAQLIHHRDKWVSEPMRIVIDYLRRCAL